MSQHTQGKLHLHTSAHDSHTLYKESRKQRKDRGIEVANGPDKEEMERLGFCWNEFEGMDTEAIPGSVARLVEAARQAKGWLEELTNEINCNTTLDKLRAALAPFERKETQE